MEDEEIRADSSERPPFHLRVSDGKYCDSLFSLCDLRLRPGIGRSRRNQVCLLADDQVSRFHAYFERDERGFVMLKDGSFESGTCSTNGTFVNSNCVRIDQNGYRLHFGDRITIGSSELIVERGALETSVKTEPEPQIQIQGAWNRTDNENPWKRRMERGDLSTSRRRFLNVQEKIAFLMGTHARLGSNSFVQVLTETAMLSLILENSARTIIRRPAPPFPTISSEFSSKLSSTETNIDVSARCFPGGKTLEEFMNDGLHWDLPGVYGSRGGKVCVGFKVKRISRIYNNSLWRPYQWRKQCISEFLPDMQSMASSEYITRMNFAQLLDPSCNEVYAFHGQDQASIEMAKDAGLSQELRFCPKHFGGGIYLSPSAFCANMAIPCPSCHQGCIGLDVCRCKSVHVDKGRSEEHVMMLARVVLGDAHVAINYDEDEYRGPIYRPRRSPPFSQQTGFASDSIISESRSCGGSHFRYRSIVVYDRFQCYPEYAIYYERRYEENEQQHNQQKEKQQEKEQQRRTSSSYQASCHYSLPS
mmetsp:Transcript_16925/g.56104  ORF Transcript_16925/g.56104 Transcript_16925/m.56104 type:complete len:532 (-) Transcript_16925:43-1638(-)